jgi:hypothetical protein
MRRQIPETKSASTLSSRQKLRFTAIVPLPFELSLLGPAWQRGFVHIKFDGHAEKDVGQLELVAKLAGHMGATRARPGRRLTRTITLSLR